jgi:hypothetical protein
LGGLNISSNLLNILQKYNNGSVLALSFIPRPQSPKWNGFKNNLKGEFSKNLVFQTKLKQYERGQIFAL